MHADPAKPHAEQADGIRTANTAPPSKVWEALTKPDLIKQNLFDTEVMTDWQVRYSIAYAKEDVVKQHLP